MRKLDRRDDRVVLDPHLVVILVFLFQATQDGDRFGHRRLIDHHHLETTLQRLVGLEILLVFVERRRTNGPQFPTRQGRLQNVGRIHRAACTSRTHKGVDLIDKEDDLAVAFGHGLHDALQTFLEFTLVLRTCDQRAHIQGIDFLALQILRHIAVDDPLGDPFGNGGLTHARLADQDRVVLGPPAQDLQHPPDFLVPADDRIELPAPGPLVQIDGILAKQFQIFFVVHIYNLLFSTDIYRLGSPATAPAEQCIK